MILTQQKQTKKFNIQGKKKGKETLMCFFWGGRLSGSLDMLM